LIQDSSPAAIPDLRFSNFHTQWLNVKLGALTMKVGSGVTPRGGATVYTNSGILFIRSQNVNDDRLKIDDATYIPNSIHASMLGSAVQPNDVLLNITGASIGRSCVVPAYFETANVNQHVCIIRLKDASDPYFIQMLLSSWRGQKLIYQHQAGGGREGLNFENIRTFKINVPNLPEQQKIATFLSAVNTKIQQLQRKRELLEQYKKGVMQKIFSQEIRFQDEDGDDYPDWEKNKLGDIGETYNGLSGKTAIDFGEGKPFITYKQIFDSSKIDTSKYGLVKVRSNERQSRVEYGDVFFTTSSETRLEVGFSSVYLGKNEELYLNSFCFGYRINSYEYFHPKFARYLFRSEGFRKLITMLGQGSTRFNMSKNEMKKLKVFIPDLSEQIKISDFLSILDRKNDNILFQSIKLQDFKKGLLQQMFV
jgi:type I restriction enzyme, S subunit